MKPDELTFDAEINVTEPDIWFASNGRKVMVFRRGHIYLRCGIWWRLDWLIGLAAGSVVVNLLTLLAR